MKKGLMYRRIKNLANILAQMCKPMTMNISIQAMVLLFNPRISMVAKLQRRLLLANRTRKTVQPWW
jgi:hypothetical protein